METPSYLAAVQPLDLDALEKTPSGNDALLMLVGSPTIASKEWAYRQYDHMVQANTVNLPGLGAGVVRVKGTDRALALSVDGNGRYCYLDPYRGAMLAVAEAAREMSRAPGARPFGRQLSQFGNPERPPIMCSSRRRSRVSARVSRTWCPSTAENVSCKRNRRPRSTRRRSRRRRSPRARRIACLAAAFTDPARSSCFWAKAWENWAAVST